MVREGKFVAAGGEGRSRGTWRENEGGLLLE